MRSSRLQELERMLKLTIQAADGQQSANFDYALIDQLARLSQRENWTFRGDSLIRIMQDQFDFRSWHPKIITVEKADQELMESEGLRFIPELLKKLKSREPKLQIRAVVLCNQLKHGFEFCASEVLNCYLNPHPILSLVSRWVLYEQRALTQDLVTEELAKRQQSFLQTRPTSLAPQVLKLLSLLLFFGSGAVIQQHFSELISIFENSTAIPATRLESQLSEQLARLRDPQDHLISGLYGYCVEYFDETNLFDFKQSVFGAEIWLELQLINSCYADLRLDDPQTWTTESELTELLYSPTSWCPSELASHNTNFELQFQLGNADPVVLGQFQSRSESGTSLGELYYTAVSEIIKSGYKGTGASPSIHDKSEDDSHTRFVCCIDN